MTFEIPRSGCKKCLWDTGCYPWKISGWETALHAIPVVGIFTSLAGWGLRANKVEALDEKIDKIYRMSLEPTLSDHLLVEEPALEEDLVKKRQVVRAKQANCTAIFITYTIIHAVIGMGIWTWKTKGNLN